MTKIICPVCGKEIEVDVSLSVVKDEPEPVPEPIPVPVPDYNPEASILTFGELLEKFNNVLTSRKYNAVQSSMDVYGILKWQYNFADSMQDKGYWAFSPFTYPLVYNYFGEGDDDFQLGYNAMQSWMLAMSLAELVPDYGTVNNTQTELFKLAYEIGGGRNYPLYHINNRACDPYWMREVGSVIQSICRGDKNYSEKIETFREELGGQPIPASCWEDLGYENEKITNETGWRRGYRTTQLGYLVNTRLFLPDAPGPRVDGTTVCELPWPWEQGQSEYQFDIIGDGNYIKDKTINKYFVDYFDMMSQTPLEKWESYPIEKKNRLINVAAIPPCTYRYMFGAPINVKFDGIQYKTYDGVTYADYFCFEKTDEETGLKLDGPFSDLEGMYRYNAKVPNERESFINTVTEITDNFRYPTQDPNYGRCRPGCAPTHDGGELNPMHGADDNEIYNIDLTAMVADTAEQKAKFMSEDGFAADSPRSYVSGHSAQIWALALLMTQFDNDNTERPKTWIRKAYEYSVNRSVGRFHWNSDCIYGRLFGSMAVPVLRAMTGLQSGMEAVKEFVLNPTPQPQPQGDYHCTIIIKNDTDAPIGSTGEIRLYVENHIGIDANLPNWAGVGEQYTFDVGESVYSTSLLVHGDNVPPTDFDGCTVNEIRFYDERHWNNIDAGYNAELDTSDPRCTPYITSGGTYVIRITNL